MERSNVPSVINTCKSLATAYHSSINFSKAIHDAQIQVFCTLWSCTKKQIQVQKRSEHTLPWALAQSVSTRWNSEYLCMKSILKSEPAIRHVLASGDFLSLKSLGGGGTFESLFWLLESPFHQSGSHFISLQVPKSTEFMKIEHA